MYLSTKYFCQALPSWGERKCSNFEKVAKGDLNPGSLDCESGILAELSSFSRAYTGGGVGGGGGKRAKR